MRAPTHFGRRSHDEWVRRLGRLIDHNGPSGRYDLDGRSVHVAWPVGIYIAVSSDTIRYVGKIRRTNSTFDDRFAGHNQPVETWDNVWILALRTDLPDLIVFAVEALLIRVLRPADNRYRPRPNIIPFSRRTTSNAA